MKLQEYYFKEKKENLKKSVLDLNELTKNYVKGRESQQNE